MESAKKDLIFHFGVGRHASFPQKPVVKVTYYFRMDQEAADRGSEMDDLKMKLMRENLYLKSLAGKPLSVYFDAYRTKAYDGGGEENLTFNVSSIIYKHV